MTHSPAPLRAVRAALFAAVAVALGALGHSYMSGTDVPGLGLLFAFVLTGGLARLGAGHRRGPLPIAGALLGVQTVLHFAFSASARHHHVAGAGAGAEAEVAGGMGMGMAGTSGMTGMSGMAAGHAHDGLGMIAAHVLAGLFCAAWLAWGEAAVFRLAAVLAAGALIAARPLSGVLALLWRRVAPNEPVPAFRRPAARARARTLRGAVHAHTAERRGPPARGRIRISAPGRPARA
ncbi:hypothetical protein J7E97_28020 [Streptomyces sp. ISL-66]|uniref:hypothetical protein n=1 Tax=Streptomyces sp. ISL-66 TaxID=2819186 RepID=UPI001BEC4BFF|nr:hypothetical protein [Streptomyces sp. ISL-66]MBT2471608.1 hypothetical protein [Streptomyces sp. ISL-66]